MGLRYFQFPPIAPKPAEIVVTRRPQGRDLYFRFAWGETYRLSPAQCRVYLKMLGTSYPDLMLDLVWNFYAVHYDTISQVTSIIPQGSVEEAFGRGSLSGRVTSMMAGVQ